MYTSVSKMFAFAVMGTVLAGAAVGCGGDEAPPTGDHRVYFFGYVYDGATGVRLTKAAITKMGIRFGGHTIGVNVEEDGRYSSTGPLPVWQDYAVSIDAAGYRPFYSQNPMIPLPSEFNRTNNGNAVAASGTTQTFQYDAYLFPTSLQAPAVTINVNLKDPTALTPLPKAAGTLRLRPISTSSDVSLPDASLRTWVNSNDMLSQTITKPFTDGVVTLAAGEMIYGVTYNASVYDVDGFQPALNVVSLLAGAETFSSIDVLREAKEGLRVVSSNSDFCNVPASGTTAGFGAQVIVTFNQNLEMVANPTYKEEVDNGLRVYVTPNPTGLTCPLKAGTDAALQERGTKVEIVGNVLTLSWNPSVAWDTVTTTCVPPQTIDEVEYRIPGSMVVQPVGGTVDQRQNLSGLLDSSYLYCYQRQ